MEIKEYFLNIFNKKIFVKELIAKNKNESPALVFLHEGLGSIPMFRDFPEKLSQITGLNCFIYDRIGYGRSDNSKERDINYLHTEAFEWLPEVIKEAALDEVILIGHSDGGTIALLYASKFRAKAIITLAAHVFVEEITIEGIKDAVKTYETTDLKTKLAKYHGEKTEKVFRHWCDTWLSKDFRNWNIEGFLPSIKDPLLVIQGEEDEYATNKQVESIVSKSGGSSQFSLIKNAKHVPHLQSEKTIVEIAEFIANIQSE